MVVLQLLVEHPAVGHDDHGVEDPLVLLVVQARQSRCASQAIELLLPRAGRVLHQVAVARALRRAPPLRASAPTSSWW